MVIQIFIHYIKKSKGGFSGKELVTPEQMELLLKRNRERIQYAAQHIFAGETNLNPVKWPNQQTALQYSPYKDIFQFDAMLPENSYRQLQSLDAKEVFELLKEEQD